MEGSSAWYADLISRGPRYASPQPSVRWIPPLRFDTKVLARDHVEVVVGDVAEPFLGLDPPLFDRLAGEVDRIVHSAALVNHVLTYDNLFGPNVVGTAELVNLAVAPT